MCKKVRTLAVNRSSILRVIKHHLQISLISFIDGQSRQTCFPPLIANAASWKRIVSFYLGNERQAVNHAGETKCIVSAVCLGNERQTTNDKSLEGERNISSHCI